MRAFSALCRIGANAEPLQFKSRLTADITTVNLKMPAKRVGDRMTYGNHGHKILHISALRRFYSKDVPVVPSFLESVNGYLAVASGSMVRLLNTDTYFTRSDFPVMEPAVHLSAYGQMLAVASLRTIEVFLVDSGIAQRICFREPSGSPQNVILQIEWINETYLAALGRETMEIYNIVQSDSSLRPVEVYCARQDTLTSAVFCERDGVQCAVVALSSGKIALEPILVNSPGSVVTFANFADMANKVKLGIISAYKAGNMFFLSTPDRNAFQIFRIDDIFRQGAAPQVQMSFESGDARFLGPWVDHPSVLFFVRMSTMSVTAIEFTDSVLEISNVVPLREFRLFDRMFTVYGISGKHVIAGNGRICSIVLKEEDPEDVDACEDEYKPPLTFWTLASIATTENSMIKGTDPTQDYNTLYNDSVAFFHVDVPRKVLSFHIKDRSEAIVGMMLAFRHGQDRPAYVMLKGRKYMTLTEKNYMFPLLPSEVKPGKKVDLEFPSRSNSDYAMQSAVIFTVKADRIQELIHVKQRDWISGGLTDYCEVKEKRSPALFQIATAISCTEGFSDEALLERIVKIMYSNLEYAGYARGIVVRVVRSNPGLVKVWSRGLLEVVKRKEVCHELWPFAWRDYRFMEKDTRIMIEHEIWSGCPEIGSVGSIVSAFSYQEAK
jgi:hypothetical protein